MKETKQSARRDTPAAGRKPGRPAKVGTKVVSVRIVDNIYDAYIRTAHRAGEDVRAITARVLIYHAPKP